MINISVTDFHNAKQAYQIAKQVYKAHREAVKNELKDLLPKHTGGGITAAELAKQCGLDSHDVANILHNFRCGEKEISRTYVMLNDDGTIDYDQKIIKHYRVNLYCR